MENIRPFNSSQMNFVASLFVFVLMLATYPYVFDRFMPIPSMQVVSVFFLCIFLLLLVIKPHITWLPMKYSLCVLFQSIMWFCYYVIHDDTSYFTRIFFLLLTYAVCLSLSNYGGITRFIKQNNKWITIQAVLAMLALILVVVGGLRPLAISENVDGRPLYFLGITCTNAYYGNMIRSAGFFDEPGALAFWGIYSLILNKMFINNKRIEILLIIGLLSTMSLAYFAQLAIYLICFGLKRFRSTIFDVCLIVVIALFIYKQGTTSELYRHTFQRVENIRYGTNRDRMIELAKKVYEENPTFGVGAQNMEKFEYMGDNPYEILAKDGYVGMFITYLPLIFILLFCFKRDVLFAVVVLMVGYMQRPFHINFLHYFFLYSFLLMCLLLQNQKDESNSTKKVKPFSVSHNGSL